MHRQIREKFSDKSGRVVVDFGDDPDGLLAPAPAPKGKDDGDFGTGAKAAGGALAHPHELSSSARAECCAAF